MIRLNFLMLSRVLVCCLFFCHSLLYAEESIKSGLLDWSEMQRVWHDDVQFHGFLSQALFSSSGNNVYGKSRNSVSEGLTEIGLNISYNINSSLSLAVQGLYRRAGKLTKDEGDVRLDFALLDYCFFRHDKGKFGVRVGRVKNPWGLYNDTRDVAFMHSTIILPLMYFERSRTLLLTADGAQLYTDYRTSVGDFSLKVNVGLMDGKDKDLLTAISLDPTAAGFLETESSFMTQFRYEFFDGQYVFMLSHADIKLKYKGLETDPHAKLKVHFNALMLSGQYNGETFGFTGEYSMQWNDFSHITPGILVNNISEHWYVQGSYRILDNVQLTLRYDSSIQDTKDRLGIKKNTLTQGFIPKELLFSQDIVFGVRWDITPHWMLRGEYHRVHGASLISLSDNTDFQNIARDWNIYGLQVAYRF